MHFIAVMSIRKVQNSIKRRRGSKALIVLPFPVSPTLRLAQLSPGPKFAGVEPLVLKRWSDLANFAPNVVVGSLIEMQRLAEQRKADGLDVSSIDRALVLLTSFGSKPLSDVARVGLWQAFGVPIFELYLGLDQTLLASECEAHEGWHLSPGIDSVTLENGELILEGAGNSGLRTGLRASMDRTTCPCGLGTTRVLNVEQLRRLDGRYLAVTA
jgi:hypothetical protein